MNIKNIANSLNGNPSSVHFWVGLQMAELRNLAISPEKLYQILLQRSAILKALDSDTKIRFLKCSRQCVSIPVLLTIVEKALSLVRRMML